MVITTINCKLNAYGKRQIQVVNFYKTIVNDENNRKLIVFNRSKEQLKIRKEKTCSCGPNLRLM